MMINNNIKMLGVLLEDMDEELHNWLVFSNMEKELKCEMAVLPSEYLSEKQRVDDSRDIVWERISIYRNKPSVIDDIVEVNGWFVRCYDR